MRRFDYNYNHHQAKLKTVESYRKTNDKAKTRTKYTIIENKRYLHPLAATRQGPYFKRNLLNSSRNLRNSSRNLLFFIRNSDGIKNNQNSF